MHVVHFLPNSICSSNSAGQIYFHSSYQSWPAAVMEPTTMGNQFSARTWLTPSCLHHHLLVALQDSFMSAWHKLESLGCKHLAVGGLLSVECSKPIKWFLCTYILCPCWMNDLFFSHGENTHVKGQSRINYTGIWYLFVTMEQLAEAAFLSFSLKGRRSEWAVSKPDFPMCHPLTHSAAAPAHHVVSILCLGKGKHMSCL